MRKASVRDLRYRFTVIEEQLRSGEEIEITKRRRVVARLLPVHPEPRKSPPDFLRMLHDIYGEKVNRVSGAELVSEQRGRY